MAKIERRISDLDSTESILVDQTNYTVPSTVGNKHIFVTVGASNRTMTIPSSTSNLGTRLRFDKLDTTSSIVNFTFADGGDSFTPSYMPAGLFELVTNGSWIEIEAVQPGEWRVVNYNQGLGYTPSISNIVGGSTITVHEIAYEITGTTVKVHGAWSANFPFGETDRFDMSLPIPSDQNFGNDYNVWGWSEHWENNSGTSYRTSVTAVTGTNNTVRFTGHGAQAGTNNRAWFEFSYRIY